MNVQMNAYVILYKFINIKKNNNAQRNAHLIVYNFQHEIIISLEEHCDMKNITITIPLATL